MPPAALTSHQGDPVDPSRPAGQWSLLFFGFTHCPDVCPTTLFVVSVVFLPLGLLGWLLRLPLPARLTR